MSHPTASASSIPSVIGGFCPACRVYENGKTKPPLTLVKLLKVLDRHPELLAEVRAA